MTDFPVGSLKDATPFLRRPFSAEAVRWKVQTTWPKDKPKSGGMVIAYVDARSVIERLNYVCPHLWSSEILPLPGNPKAFFCKLTIDGQTRTDVGMSTHSEKGIASDALKRTAVHFGVGVSIYALSQVKLNASAGGGMSGTGKNAKPTLKQVTRGRGDSADLTDEGRDWLREKYNLWLGSEKNTFGDPLDHGEVADAIGMEDDHTVPEDAGSSLEEQAQIQRLRDLYEEKVDKRKLGKGRFEAQLKAADTPEKREALATHLGTLAK